MTTEPVPAETIKPKWWDAVDEDAVLVEKNTGAGWARFERRDHHDDCVGMWWVDLFTDEVVATDYEGGREWLDDLD
jgi:hypothetical protein